MKFLFVAPEISSPYTEGRKRFVLDLVRYASDQHYIYLLTTTKAGQHANAPCDFSTTVHSHPALHLTSLIAKLSDTIKYNKPDVICLFPYGTFRHIYGLATRIFIYAINRICDIRGIPCITLMYSIDEHITIEKLAKEISCLAVSTANNPNTININVGIDCQNINYKKLDNNTRNILFMAGMWQTTAERVEHVINLRGLGVLLQAGSALSEQEIKLIIASPLFCSGECRKQVLEHKKNSWPASHLIFRNEVKIPDIFNECDLFAFPYQDEITQFIPTSVLEAMCAGCCTAISDKAFLEPLAKNGETAYLMPVDDVNATATILAQAMDSQEERRAIASKARRYVEENWSVEHSLRQLETEAAKLLRRH